MTISGRKITTVAPSVLVLAFMASLGPFGDTEYTPSLPNIARGLDISYGHAQLSMTLYLLGFSLSQVFYGPFSDRYGRRPMIILATMFFVVGSVICALTPDLLWLLTGRFIQATGASAGSVLSNAAIRDSFPPERRTKVFLKVNTAFSIAPGLGPIAGSLVDHFFGWRANFGLLTFLGCLLIGTLYFSFPETNRHKNVAATRPKTVLRNYLSLFANPGYTYYVIVDGIGIGIAYCALVEAPSLVMNDFGKSSNFFMVVAVSVVGSFIIGSLICTWMTSYFADSKLIIIGLGIMLVSSLTTGLIIWIDWVTLFGMLTTISVVFFGLAFVIPISISRSLAPYEDIVGVASSMTGCVSMFIASASTYLISLLHNFSSPIAIFVTFTLLSTAGLFYSVVAQWRFSRNL